MTAPIVIAAFGGLAAIAIAAACVAARLAHTARTALRACEAKHRESVELNRKLESGNKLTRDIGHDLNDLLTAITGQTELLIVSLDPSGPSIQDVHEIRIAALSAARLTKALRTASGGHRMSTDVVDVNAVTTRAAGPPAMPLRPSGQPGARQRHQADQTREPPRRDRAQPGIHARDAMPGGGRLTVATMMPPTTGGCGRRAVRSVWMVIADTGGGMSADARATLFEPFFASEEAGGDRPRESERDRRRRAGASGGSGSAGTTFTIDLPATSEPAAGSSVALADTRLAAPVLVVEDEPRVRELIRLVLVRAGHEVVAVAGPHAALAALNRQPEIALMLVDVVMPEMDGYDLMAEARKISPRIHVVLMSGFARDMTRLSTADGFLEKPFTVDSLTGIVEHALTIADPPAWTLPLHYPYFSL
jgi:CheY-like chemotaxis protein